MFNHGGGKFSGIRYGSEIVVTMTIKAFMNSKKGIDVNDR